MPTLGALAREGQVACRSSSSRQRKTQIIRAARQGEQQYPTPRPACAASSRRSALLAAALLVTVRPALAEDEVPLKKYLSKTLRAPAQLLKSRLRQDNGAKILAPIRASKERLLDAEKELQKINIYDPDYETYKRVLSMIRGASLNCYPFEALSDDALETKASQLQKTLRIGDPCTFRLITRNVTLLLTASQQKLKQATLDQLDELIRSYEMLDEVVDAARLGSVSAAERVPEVLQFASAHTTSFETQIERCLGLDPSNLAPRAFDIS